MVEIPIWCGESLKMAWNIWHQMLKSIARYTPKQQRSMGKPNGMLPVLAVWCGMVRLPSLQMKKIRWSKV